MTIIVKNCDGCAKSFKRATDAMVLGMRTDAGAYIQYHLCRSCCLVLSGEDDASAALNQRVMTTANKRATMEIAA
jgi:hypothetical protein